MKEILVSNLVPGMVVGEDVYTYNNHFVLPADVILTDKMITRLEFYTIQTVKIKDGPILEQIPSHLGESYSSKVKQSEEFKQFENRLFTSLEEFKSSINSAVTKNTSLDPAELLFTTTKILPKNFTGLHVFDMLHNMRNYDDLTYMHSINVSLICRVFGEWLQMEPADIDVLTVAGLLHDIGKLTIPDSILSKPAKLNDEEYTIIKTHTVQGYNLLKSQNIDERIKSVALMHHERCDRSGYPLGLSSHQIIPFAKIVAIADIYDAMTAARVYRGPLCPFKVVAIFESEGLQKYDPRFILTFLERIVNTYMNNRVLLSDGQEGDVILINRQSLSRPIIRLKDNFIDLSQTPDLSIEAII